MEKSGARGCYISQEPQPGSEKVAGEDRSPDIYLTFLLDSERVYYRHVLSSFLSLGLERKQEVVQCQEGIPISRSQQSPEAKLDLGEAHMHSCLLLSGSLAVGRENPGQGSIWPPHSLPPVFPEYLGKAQVLRMPLQHRPEEKVVLPKT